MGNITFKAIPTTFKGVNLKSRFEGDIAFLVDGLGYKWDYEPQSFLLENGVHYLPDFYIADLNLYIECRGYETDKGEAQIRGFAKMIADGKLSQGHKYPDYLVIGPNKVTFYECYARFGVNENQDVMLCRCDKCGRWFFVGTYGSYQCRKCGRWDGDHHMKDARWLEYQDGVLLIGYLKATVREFIEQISEGEE